MTVVEKPELTDQEPRGARNTEADPAAKAVAETPSRTKIRLAYLDWLRGIAAIIMIQGHTFHSFAGDRTGSWYTLSQFFGGMAPATFLFLTGITYSLGMERSERQALSAWQKVTAALGRARYLFVLAVLFRLQVWLSGLPGPPASDLLKVDILNCMGFGMAMLAGLAILNSENRTRYAALAGLLIAAASPLVSLLPWSQAPWLLRVYFEPSNAYFSFFPWASFLAFGVAAGGIITRVKPEHTGTMLQWAALAGVGLVITAQYFSNLPYSVYYGASSFWLNSPGLPLIKLGVVLLWAGMAYIWTQYGTSPTAWSWVRQLGTSSLLVYWVHIEIVYGRWLGIWKEKLPDWACVLFSLGVIASMVLLAWGKDRFVERRRNRLAPANLAVS